MNCEQFRALIGAEPNSTSPEALAHVEQCAECASYRQEMQAMDRLIYRALAVDAPSAETKPLFDAEETSARKQSSPRLWRIAASLLITAGTVAATSLWLLTPRDSLAAEVIDHAMHEPASLVRTSHTVPTDELATILAKSRLRLKPAMGRVSYAMSCEFRGHRIPHLVVQTDRGPVTVLVITEVAKQSREQINEAGFQGVIVPAPRGVIVVLGKNVPVDAVANTVLDAVEYL